MGDGEARIWTEHGRRQCVEWNVDLGDLRKSTESDVVVERFLETFYAHAIQEKEIPYYLKEFNFLGKINQDIIHYVADIFELSKDWLMGHSLTATVATVTPTEPVQSDHLCADFESWMVLAEYIIACKQMAWNPKVIFLQATGFSKDVSNGPITKEAIILIELSKITSFSMSLTTYKQWNVEDWQSVSTLCQKAGLFCKGLKIDKEKYQQLKERKLIPAEAIREPLAFWDLETNNKEDRSSFLRPQELQFQECVDRVRYTAIQATRRINL